MSRSTDENPAKDQSQMEEESSDKMQEQTNIEQPPDEDNNMDTAAESTAAQDSDNSTSANNDQVSHLQEQLEEARQQADENLNGWQRALAEFSNFKKRTERESTETRIRLKGDILMPLLDVYDDLKLALLDKPDDGDGGQWAAGIEMIYLKFQSQLNSMEVEVIDEKGVPFDPNLHEAITYEESEDVEEGHVIDVFQSGYRIGERVIRPARVRVAR